MNYYFDIDSQLIGINDYIKSEYYNLSHLDPALPIDIAKARIIAEEREIDLNLSEIQLKDSKESYIQLITERRLYEMNIDETGGETPPTPPPLISRPALRRRQNKTRWCYATTALIYAIDSGYITDEHMNNINNYVPLMYKKDPKIRLKYCGYDATRDMYFCDSGQEYVVSLCGDDPKSCVPNSVLTAISLLTNRRIKKIGNNNNRFWTNDDGSLNLFRQNKLASEMKLPAICDVFLNGDSTTGKGHSLLITDMKYENDKITLYTEECIFGEHPVITDFSQNIFTSVYNFKSKITNIYFVE